MMRNLLAIAVKDLKSNLRDRTTLFWLTLGPMLIVGLISAAYSEFGGGRNMAAQAVPGFTLMFMLFGVMGVGESFFEERENGTWQRLLISSVTKSELLGGKLLAGYLIALGQMLLLFLMGYFVFKVPFGYTAGGRAAVLLIMVAGSLAALALGLFVASLFSNRKQFSAFFTILILMMCQIGGAWTPLFLMPKWIQELSRFTFVAHAMEAFNLTYFGEGLRAVLPNLGALLVFAAVCFMLSYYLLETSEAKPLRRRRKIATSFAVLAIVLFTGSRLNSISYPSFLDKRVSAREKDAGAGPQAGDGLQAAEQAWARKETDAALTQVEKLIAKDAANAQVLAKYADWAIEANALARAEEFLASRAGEKGTAPLHFQIGRIATERFRRDPSLEEKQKASMRAIQHLSSAIEIDPAHWEARLSRGIVYSFIPAEFNQGALAIDDFEWLVKNRPELAIAHRYLADAHLRARNVARARQVLEEALRKFPEDRKLQERLDRLGAARQ